MAALENMGMTDEMNLGVGKAVSGDLRLTGAFDIKHLRNGELVSEREIKNTVMNAGFVEIAGLMGSDTTSGFTAFDYVAIGEGTTAPAVTQTQLVSEISTFGGARAAGTGTNVTSTWNATQNDTLQIVYTFAFTAGAVFAITEAGIFNAASTGTMLCRQTFAAVNVVENDSLQIIYKISAHS